MPDRLPRTGLPARYAPSRHCEERCDEAISTRRQRPARLPQAAATDQNLGDCHAAFGGSQWGGGGRATGGSPVRAASVPSGPQWQAGHKPRPYRLRGTPAAQPAESTESTVEGLHATSPHSLAGRGTMNRPSAGPCRTGHPVRTPALPARVIWCTGLTSGRRSGISGSERLGEDDGDRTGWLRRRRHALGE